MRQISPYCFSMSQAELQVVTQPTPTSVRPESANTAVVRRLGTSDRSSQRIKVVDAALRCLARLGTTKTTVDDIAREAGLSRATLYRIFPGGKEGIFSAVVDTEVARLFSALAVAMGEATDLEDVLVAGISEAASRLTSHAALSYLFEFEPGVIQPVLAFSEGDRLLLVASDFAAPFFGRWLEHDQALRAAEWAVRIVVSYIVNPAQGVDLSQADHARRLVQAFVLPGIQSLMVIDTDLDPTSVGDVTASFH